MTTAFSNRTGWMTTLRRFYQDHGGGAAAVSAVNATAHGGPDITTQARGVAAQNECPHGVKGITVTSPACGKQLAAIYIFHFLMPFNTNFNISIPATSCYPPP